MAGTSCVKAGSLQPLGSPIAAGYGAIAPRPVPGRRMSKSVHSTNLVHRPSQMQTGPRRSPFAARYTLAREAAVSRADSETGHPCDGPDRPAHDSPQTERAPAAFLE